LLLFSVILFCSLYHESESFILPKFGADFNAVIRQLDEMKVEGSAEKELKWKDFATDLKDKLQRIPFVVFK